MNRQGIVRYFVAGWTARILYLLKTDRKPLEITGTVQLSVCNESGAAVSLGGSVGIESDIEGKVYYDPPPSGGLMAGTYYVRWKYTEAATGKVSYFPSASIGTTDLSTEIWQVGK